MAAKIKPRGLEDLLRAMPLDVRDDASPGNAEVPGTVTVQRRGQDAVLDTDDCEIIVFGLFPDRA